QSISNNILPTEYGINLGTFDEVVTEKAEFAPPQSVEKRGRRNRLKKSENDAGWELEVSRNKPDILDYIPADIAKEVQWLKERFPTIDIKIVRGLIKGGSFGTFYQNLVKLSDIAEEGTAYHEAFHVAFRLGLNSSE